MSRAWKTAVVLNPRAGSGKAERVWPQIGRQLESRMGHVELRRTQHSGHGIELARDLLEHGYDRIIVAGGDGTVSEVANGFLERDRPVNPEACLGLLPLGTGGDFRRTIGVSKDFRRAIDQLGEAAPTRIDAGRVRFQGRDGTPQTRYFINVASFGMGGEVAARSSNFLSPLGGTVAFLYASAVSLLGYRCKTVRLTVDQNVLPAASIFNVAVGNGRFHGGGMQACPRAVLNDGALEVTLIRCMSRFRVLKDFPVLYSDNIYRHRKVGHARGRRLLAEADEPVRIEIDGEPLGTLPLEITVIPEALSVLIPPGGAPVALRR